MKGQQGFVTILWLSCLPVIIAVGLGASLMFSFFKTDLALLNTCRSEQLKTQGKVAGHLEKLLRLNPRALKLRMQEAKARVAEIAARSYPPLYPAAKMRLVQVQGLRRALAIKQNALIATANMWLVRGGQELPGTLTQAWRRESSPLTPWMKSSLSMDSARVPKLAVEPDLRGDTAPLYRPTANFENEQTWQQTWSLKMKGNLWLEKFLNYGGNYSRSCASSLYGSGVEWSPQLRQVKSWSKALW